MGDEIDSIPRSDKRFDIKAIHPDYRGERNFIDLMVDDFIDIMAPLRGKIRAGVDSNHHRSYRKISDSDPFYRISQALEYVRLGYGGFVPLMFHWHSGERSNRVRTVIPFVTHGKPTTAITPGGSINTLAGSAQWFANADIVAHGHTHRLSSGLSRILFECDPSRETYGRRKQHLVQTGSFLKSYAKGDEAEFSPYSEVRLYPPIDLGWAVGEIGLMRDGVRIKMMVEEF
jgi:hypothetical protein